MSCPIITNIVIDSMICRGSTEVSSGPLKPERNLRYSVWSCAPSFGFERYSKINLAMVNIILNIIIAEGGNLADIID